MPKFKIIIFKIGYRQNFVKRLNNWYFFAQNTRIWAFGLNVWKTKASRKFQIPLIFNCWVVLGHFAVFWFVSAGFGSFWLVPAFSIRTDIFSSAHEIYWLTYSSTDDFLSPIPNSDWLVFYCGNLILHVKEKRKW